MDYIIYLVLAASILALGFAFYFYKSMLKEDEGTDSGYVGEDYACCLCR